MNPAFPFPVKVIKFPLGRLCRDALREKEQCIRFPVSRQNLPCTPIQLVFSYAVSLRSGNLTEFSALATWAHEVWPTSRSNTLCSTLEKISRHIPQIGPNLEYKFSNIRNPVPPIASGEQLAQNDVYLASWNKYLACDHHCAIV